MTFVYGGLILEPLILTIIAQSLSDDEVIVRSCLMNSDALKNWGGGENKFVLSCYKRGACREAGGV